MSRLDDLPPDQRATLSLLLRRGKTYAQVAGMLEISERAVHDRAHAALAVLAAREARALTAQEREEVGDYLLGQRSRVGERLATRTLLEGSPEARAWAGVLAEALQPLAGAALPEIPNGSAPASAASTSETRAAQPLAAATAEPDPASPGRLGAGTRRRTSSPSSRLGGGLLLAAIVAGIVVAIVLLTGGGSHGSSDSAGGEAASTATTSSEAQKAQAKEDNRITLTPANANSRSVGIAEVLSEGSQYAFYLAAQNLPPSKGKGFFYAVWLYNGPTAFQALGRVPDVGSSGNVQGGALLPKDAGKYHTMLITRETAAKPSRPGPIVLRGAFALH